MPKNSTTPAVADLSTSTPPGPVDDDPRSPTARAGAAYRQILLRIIRGELAAGTELKTTQIARELQLSRTPVREALAALAADGIVEQQVNHPAVVRQGAENWLVQVHELRLLIEPAATARAAEQMPEETLARLERLANAAAPVKGEGWMLAARRFDYALHLSIAEHCGNLPLRESLRKCWSFKGLSYAIGQDRPEVLERGYREHLAILAALKARNSDAASAAMQLHLLSAAQSRPAERVV